jgi:hypothetical protein
MHLESRNGNNGSAWYVLKGLAKLPVDAVLDGESWPSTPTGGDHST